MIRCKQCKSKSKPKTLHKCSLCESSYHVQCLINCFKKITSENSAASADSNTVTFYCSECIDRLMDIQTKLDAFNAVNERQNILEEEHKKLVESTKMIDELRDQHKLVEERANELEKIWLVSKTKLGDAYKTIQDLERQLQVNSLHDSKLPKDELPKPQDFKRQEVIEPRACLNPDSRLEGQGSTQNIDISSPQKAREHQLSSQRLGSFDTDFLIKVIKEDRKRFSRRLNICIRGLPSSGDDEQSFLSLCQLHLDLDPTLIANSIVSVNRVGDTGCLKPRVLIVKLNCLNTRKIILRNSYKLKNFLSCAGTNIFVSPDLSRGQLLIRSRNKRNSHKQI